MQDDFDAIYSQRKRKKEDEDEFDAIYRPKPPVEQERPNVAVRSARALGEIARHPIDAAVSIGKGLYGNAKDLVAMEQAYRGNTGMMADAFVDEYNKGGNVEQRLKLRALGAVSLAVPTLRVGGAATSFLANTAANAGLGAAQTPDDPAVGAVLGAVVPHVIPKVGSLARKATGALARRAMPMVDFDLSGVTKDVLAGADEGMRNSMPRRRVAGKGNTAIQGPRRAPEQISVDDIAELAPIDRILAERTPRQISALDAHTVRPSDPVAPIGAAQPGVFHTTVNAPEPEVVTGGLDTNGRRIVVTNPEVKASRVADERLDNAEQRAAENQMVKEVREIDAEREAGEKAATKEAQAAEREQEKMAAKAAAEADKAARTAEKAAKAAALAKQRQSDNAAREAAKAAGTLKEFSAQQRALKAEKLAADAQEKAALAAQAAQDAAAKKVAAEAIVSARTTKEAPAPETAQGMLGVANAKFSEQKRRTLAAQAVLARRKSVEPTPVAPVADTPVPTRVPVVAPVGGASLPIQPPEPPAAPLGAPLTGSNPPGIPEVGQAPVHTLQPADKPFLNWRTLGVDPSKPDALSMSAAARVQAAASRPEMVERLAAERGKTTFAAMSEEAKKTWAIDQLGVDRLAVDGKKLIGLTGAQIHELKAPLLENAGLMEGIARELPNLQGDELAHAQRVFEGLERSNDEILAAIQREGSARGRDLGALRQVAMMTTDPAVWLVKAKQALGDRPMTADIQAKIMKLAQEAAEACGGI